MIRVMLATATVLAAAGCTGMDGWSTAPERGYDYQHAPAMATNGMWTGPTGMTLYTYDKDAVGAGTSACAGPCATNWPPLYAPDGTVASANGDWTIVRRADGRLQWAYKGHPLYYWSRDARPGDTTGDGFNNAWRIARP